MVKLIRRWTIESEGEGGFLPLNDERISGDGVQLEHMRLPCLAILRANNDGIIRSASRKCGEDLVDDELRERVSFPLRLVLRRRADEQ